MTIGDFVWDNPAGPTKVEKLGVGALSCRWPADVPYKETQLEMVVVSYPAEVFKEMGAKGALKSTMGTYLGTMKDPEEINKTLFFGSTAARRVYRGSIPKKQETHVYSKVLEDGSYVVVALRAFEPRSDKLGDLLRAVANTFRKSS